MASVINFTHITILQWILIVVFSGIVVAVINQLGAWLVGGRTVRSQERMQKGELAFRERQQKNERENQSLQLLITAHFEQRAESLTEAADVRQWIWQLMYRLYGPDHDYYGDNEPTANLSSVVDVLTALNKIVYFHPTKSVRRQAEMLSTNIASKYNRVSDDHTQVGSTPDEDELRMWLDSADKIIDLIHTPPTLDEVRRPANDEAAQDSPTKRVAAKPLLKALDAARSRLRRKKEQVEDISDLFET